MKKKDDSDYEASLSEMKKLDRLYATRSDGEEHADTFDNTEFF